MSARRLVLQGSICLVCCVYTYVVSYYFMVGKLIEGQSAAPVYFLFGKSAAAFFAPMHRVDTRIRRSYWGKQEPVRTSGNGPHLLLLERDVAKRISQEEIERMAAEIAMDGNVLVVECQTRPFVYVADRAKASMNLLQRRSIHDRLQARGYVETDDPRYDGDQRSR